MAYMCVKHSSRECDGCGDCKKNKYEEEKRFLDECWDDEEEEEEEVW